MTRSLLLICLLIGAATTWIFETGCSHPWKDLKTKRSPLHPLMQERAQLVNETYIRKRRDAAVPTPIPTANSTVLPQPPVRENAKKESYQWRG
ncbi:hypothetical protein PRIPAC_97694 [Pristionchus pacificus]|uniref:Uncharacterized protein n=1 Tax=Pristionchus pacificus TaxID=54126 RepID=A0A2A6BXT5_PRIPA|nr:hypothetical protein PRIPAC_97694 [Pristionchus pacificus]|eukprot:PDM70698.1 hypothetical protein PRIPAC_43903 [Pristionchus pacificus]